jgi:hypothetical protein
MVEEESDDAEAVVRLLELNDIINTIIEKYNLIRKGDLNAAKSLPTVASHISTPTTTKAPATDDSLIDLLGGEVEPTNGSSSAAGPSNVGSLQDDLLGLSIDDPSASIAQGGGIALGFGANTSISYRAWPVVSHSLMDIQIFLVRHCYRLPCKPTPPGSSTRYHLHLPPNHLQQQLLQFRLIIRQYSVLYPPHEHQHNPLLHLANRAMMTTNGHLLRRSPKDLDSSQTRY